MNINEAIEFLDKQIKNPSLGLPEEFFLFVSRITPMINVDLLVKDEKGRTLLSWRNDQFCNMGWHIPGGVIRFKETFETRIQKVAETEIGATVQFDPVPIAVNEFILENNIRGHSISLLYKCFLPGKFTPKNTGLSNKDNGYLAWHDFCPKDLIKVQELYKKYI